MSTNVPLGAPGQRRSGLTSAQTVLVVCGVVVGGLLVLVVIVLAVAAAFVAVTRDDSNTDAASMASQAEVDAAVQVEGEPVPAGSVGATSPRVQAMDLRDPDQRVLLGGAEGPQVVLVAAHWDPYSRATVSAWGSSLESDDDPGAPVVVVASANDPQAEGWPPSVWLGEAGWPADLPVALDSSTLEVAEALGGGQVFPFAVAIDGDGVVVARQEGEMDAGDLEQLRSDAIG